MRYPSVTTFILSRRLGLQNRFSPRAEALRTGVILGELSAILAGRFRTVREGRASLPLDKRPVWEIHSFLQ